MTKPIIVLFYTISNLKLKVCKLFDWAYSSLVKCLYECLCMAVTPASESSMVAYDFNPRTLKDEILGSSQVWEQPGLSSEILSQKKKNKVPRN